MNDLIIVNQRLRCLILRRASSPASVVAVVVGASVAKLVGAASPWTSWARARVADMKLLRRTTQSCAGYARWNRERM